MILQSKPLAQLTEADLHTLLDDQVPEGKLLDYKRELPGQADADKKEFLFDVSSFANASGGYLVYGFEESGGIPKQLVGVGVTNADAEMRRLQSLVLDAVDPRIPGLDFGFVPLANGRGVIVVSIPKSWALPHMVTLKGTNKFYSRNAAGKHPVDVDELRDLFVSSNGITERVKKFKTERVSQILADETPIPLAAGPKTILHIMPIQSFAARLTVDLRAARTLPAGLLTPLGAGGYNQRINLDGLLHYTGGINTGASAYLQLYRTGVIETVDANTLHSGAANPRNPTTSIIPSTTFEGSLVSQIPTYLLALQKLGAAPPFVISLTLTGVKGFIMAGPERFISGTPAFDRDVVFIPELFVERTDCQAVDFKPMLDAVWNAGGIVSSPNFDGQGNWMPTR